ncbi:hypothetical protein AK812_SmicGene46928, partial [Symbiodinium microadriaticum]
MIFLGPQLKDAGTAITNSNDLTIITVVVIITTTMVIIIIMSSRITTVAFETDASQSRRCDKARMRLLLDYVAGGLVFLNCLLLMLELE